MAVGKLCEDLTGIIRGFSDARSTRTLKKSDLFLRKHGAEKLPVFMLFTVNNLQAYTCSQNKYNIAYINQVIIIHIARPWIL